MNKLHIQYNPGSGIFCYQNYKSGLYIDHRTHSLIELIALYV